MDRYLRAWAERVKARHRPLYRYRERWYRERPGRPMPVLWLFTDAARLPDPLAVVARLPRGLCGVVLRHDADPGRGALARAVARLCRARRLALSIAVSIPGDWRLAAGVGAGLHLRGGRAPGPMPACVRDRLLTASAHDAREVAQARRAGAHLVFISPLFATASHPGAPALGPLRWSGLVRAVPGRAAALGGIGRARLRAVPRTCRAVGAIEAFVAD